MFISAVSFVSPLDFRTERVCVCGAGFESLLGEAAVLMVSLSMKALVDALWAVWSIGVSIYDYIHTSAMEERIHTLESVITVHQCVIGLLTAGLVALFTYILLRKH